MASQVYVLMSFDILSGLCVGMLVAIIKRSNFAQALLLRLKYSKDSTSHSSILMFITSYPGECGISSTYSRSAPLGISGTDL